LAQCEQVGDQKARPRPMHCGGRLIGPVQRNEPALAVRQLDLEQLIALLTSLVQHWKGLFPQRVSRMDNPHIGEMCF